MMWVGARASMVAAVLAIGSAAAARAQSFMSLVGDANHAELNGQHLDAAKLYEQAYKVSGFDPVALALAAVSSGHGGDRAGAASYLRRATADGLVDPRFLNILRGDSALRSFDSDTAWTNAVTAAQQRADAIDKPLRAELIDLAARDQLNRLEIDSVMARFGTDTPPAESLLVRMAAADSGVQARLGEIVDSRGWPGRALVGDDGAHAAWLILQHSPIAVQRRVLPLLKAAVDRHDARPSDLALLEDRVLVADGKPQRYGSQMEASSAGGPPALDPIENEPCVDERRAAVGLESLGEYLSHFGVQYTLPPGASKARCSAK